MIICSCSGITDADIEDALVSIMSVPEPPLPTPGVVYRELGQKLKCCGCAPLLVETIYDKLQALEARGRVCPYRCRPVLEWLAVLKSRRTGLPAGWARDMPVAAE